MLCAQPALCAYRTLAEKKERRELFYGLLETVTVLQANLETLIEDGRCIEVLTDYVRLDPSSLLLTRVIRFDAS